MCLWVVGDDGNSHRWVVWVERNGALCVQNLIGSWGCGGLDDVLFVVCGMAAGDGVVSRIVK